MIKTKLLGPIFHFEVKNILLEIKKINSNKYSSEFTTQGFS